jgi:hypothetical protein
VWRDSDGLADHGRGACARGGRSTRRRDGGLKTLLCGVICQVPSRLAAVSTHHDRSGPSCAMRTAEAVVSHCRMRPISISELASRQKPRGQRPRRTSSYPCGGTAPAPHAPYVIRRGATAGARRSISKARFPQKPSVFSSGAHQLRTSGAPTSLIRSARRRPAPCPSRHTATTRSSACARRRQCRSDGRGRGRRSARETSA